MYQNRIQSLYGTLPKSRSHVARIIVTPIHIRHTYITLSTHTPPMIHFPAHKTSQSRCYITKATLTSTPTGSSHPQRIISTHPFYASLNLVLPTELYECVPIPVELEREAWHSAATQATPASLTSKRQKTYEGTRPKIFMSSSCPFCSICESSVVGSDLRDVKNAFVLLSTRHCVAFLDIQPMTLGHTLVVPREHCMRLTDLSSESAAEVGRVMPLLARTVCAAVGEQGGGKVTDFNCIQNNGPSAGQVVDHVHFHLIPRGDALAKWNMFGKGQREDIDDEEGAALAARVRSYIAEDAEARSAKL
ncbi:hypothetical protein G7K_0889-t1 [Saitoella complicata NRRL Y-17804]|uniref:HIT domain-containing protein n=1 Tax=Saitoella complicata (strain BCRC 22490 / CBS 7301 / JCM 7358 / NBRC 10748 / NRRL Y-17804) TaxID=698492 RepID=A0A0E9NA41_SAICN|nr:hypothetical protein G7K_0889-t1 [Saitoella complicata NRRL Y-17804]